MARIIEVDDEGNILLPREALGTPEPRARYQVEVNGNTVTLRRLDGQPAILTDPQEWATDFIKWTRRRRPSAPILPDDALRRESTYD